MQAMPNLLILNNTNPYFHIFLNGMLVGIVNESSAKEAKRRLCAQMTEFGPKYFELTAVQQFSS